LATADREAFAEAARLAGLASRRYAAEAEARGVEVLSRAGMHVVREIDRDQFVTAMGPARQKFEKLFSPGLLEWVQETS
jgi:TRAP-type C4-dicarboxylate transport system substrate-binding protein